MSSSMEKLSKQISVMAQQMSLMNQQISQISQQITTKRPERPVAKARDGRRGQKREEDEDEDEDHDLSNIIGLLQQKSLPPFWKRGKTANNGMNKCSRSVRVS